MPAPVRHHDVASPEDGLFLGRSPAAARVREEIRRAAGTAATVLVAGESGVGKELVAREIHAHSARRAAPFVALNSAAIPDTLFESEMFGHESGAFTDARASHRGAMERAHGGSLFLDEIGDLSRVVQPKLLRALEEGEALRVGGESPRRFDVRFIAATNHSLRSMCREGQFRLDLYYRLRVIEIRVPPLRDRLDDIAVLAEHFARHILAASGRPFVGLSQRALPLLMRYHWPGNVRELRTVIERALSTDAAPVVDISETHIDRDSDSRVTLRGLLDKDWHTARHRFEAAYAAHMLALHDGDVKKAARTAGLVPRSLYKMLRRLGLRPGPEPAARGRGGGG